MGRINWTQVLFFGLAAVWMNYPLWEASFRDVRQTLESRQQRK